MTKFFNGRVGSQAVCHQLQIRSAHDFEYIVRAFRIRTILHSTRVVLWQVGCRWFQVIYLGDGINQTKQNRSLTRQQDNHQYDVILFVQLLHILIKMFHLGCWTAIQLPLVLLLGQRLSLTGISNPCSTIFSHHHPCLVILNLFLLPHLATFLSKVDRSTAITE